MLVDMEVNEYSYGFLSIWSMKFEKQVGSNLFYPCLILADEAAGKGKKEPFTRYVRRPIFELNSKTTSSGGVRS